MKTGPSFLRKVFALGPWPYLCLAVAILGVGAVLQIWSGTVNNLGEGQTIFGVFSKIGGAVGLFGLVPLAVRLSTNEKQVDPSRFVASSRLPKIPTEARPNATAAAPKGVKVSKPQVALSPGMAVKLVRMALRQGRRAL